jgi:hypothetical protein
MVPPTWMIEELERLRREREEQERPRLHIELPLAPEGAHQIERQEAPRGVIVIDF